MTCACGRPARMSGQSDTCALCASGAKTPRMSYRLWSTQKRVQSQRVVTERKAESKRTTV